MVTLTATPAAGSTFAGWSGAGCSGTGACTVTMSSDQAVTATFNVVRGSTSPCGKRKPVGPPVSPDYCVPLDWRAYAEPGSKTPGHEPLNVIIRARSTVSLDDIRSALDWHRYFGCWKTVSAEKADVTVTGVRYVPQEEAWRRGGCIKGFSFGSFDGNEDHIRFWSQPIPGTLTETWFATASFETACFVLSEKKHVPFNDEPITFWRDHWGEKWHCVDGDTAGGSYGKDGYDRRAKQFVDDLRAKAAANRWHVTVRKDRGEPGTGLDGVKYPDTVYVVTVTKD